MEFLTAALAYKTTGTHHSCNFRDTELTASVMQVADYPNFFHYAPRRRPKRGEPH